jgi:carbon monoxide dehydrogenase subunit G
MNSRRKRLIQSNFFCKSRRKAIELAAQSMKGARAMAVKFDGYFETERAPEDVYDFLTDPKKFAPLLPDFQSMTQQDATHFAVKVNVGISYIKGSADIKMELTQAERPRRAQYVGEAKVPGGKLMLSAGFDLRPAGDGTTANWQGEVQILGGLASVGGGLLELLGRKNVQRLIDALRAELNGSGDGQPPLTLPRKRMACR